MGNCLILQGKVVKIVKPDGKILEYKAPVEVQQILSDFSGHAVSNSFQALQHLLPDTKLLGGKLYYLIPPPLPSPDVKKKKVRFSIPEQEDGAGTGALRIKLVIRKQELREMMKNGRVSADMMSMLQDQQRAHKVDDFDQDDDCKGWKPALDIIPELS